MKSSPKNILTFWHILIATDKITMCYLITAMLKFEQYSNLLTGSTQPHNSIKYSSL